MVILHNTYMATTASMATGTKIINSRKRIKFIIRLFALFAPHLIRQAVRLIGEIPLRPSCRLGLREIVIRMAGHHCSVLLPGFEVGMAAAVAVGMQAVADTEAVVPAAGFAAEQGPRQSPVDSISGRSSSPCLCRLSWSRRARYARIRTCT